MGVEREAGGHIGAPDRRRLLRGGLALGAGALGLTGLEACEGGGGAPAASSDAQALAAPAVEAAAAAATAVGSVERDLLNLSLSFEYLSAQFYAVAVGGAGVASNLLSGTGARASANGARRVTFTDPLVAQAAAEIAADKLDHLSTLRSALGAAAVGQPAIDLSPAPTGAFSRLAQSAGLVAAGTAFDPYAGDDHFLLAASMFEGVAAAGHRGALPSLATASFVAAGTLVATSTDAHRGLVRALVASRAIDEPTLNGALLALAKAKARLDGTASDTDLTLRNGLVSTLPDANEPVPYSRTSAQALSVYYINSAAASSGGFFPSGVNGPFGAGRTAIPA